jgi:hypothetical protein
MDEPQINQAVGGSPLGPIEPAVMGIISAIPVPQLKIWAAAYFRPAETFDSQRASICSNKLGVELAMMSLIPFIVAFLAMLAALQQSPNILLAFAVLLVVSVLSFVLGFVIVSVLLFILAKILGGKAPFYEHSYALALVAGGYYVMAFPFYLLNLIPLVGGIFGFAILLIGLYDIYNFFVMMRHAHQLSSARAAVLVAVPIVIMGALMGAAILAMIGLAAAAKGTV